MQVYLMGTGHAMNPLEFLLQHIKALDLSAIRHLIHKILSSILPPFSVAFGSKMAAFLLSASAQKVIR